MNDLEDWRHQLDKIDSQIVELLAERFKITDQIGHYKQQANLKIHDAAREAIMLERLERLALSKDLHPDLVGKIYAFILDQSKASQASIMDNSGMLND